MSIIMRSPRRRSLVVIRLVFGLTATALLVSIFMFYEESFLQRLTTLRTSLTTTTTTTTTNAPPILQQQQEALEGRQRQEASFLNVRPIGLTQCTTVRFRSKSEEESESAVSYTVEEAMNILQNQQQQQQQRQHHHIILPHTPPPLRVGLVFVENPNDFVSLSKGVFHLFHFLEFLIVAYTELHRLQHAMAVAAATNDVSGSVTTAVMNSNKTASSAAATLQAVQVPWLYVPVLTRQEICGAAQGMNCLILQMVLTASLPVPTTTTTTTTQSSSSPQQRPVAIDIFGVESNDHMTRQVHEAFRGIFSKRKKQQQQQGIIQSSSSSLFSQQQQQHAADLVLLVDRQSCKRQQQQRIQKMWTNYISDNNNNNNNNNNDNNDNNESLAWQQARPSRRFPAELWHADVMTALGGGADALYPPPPLPLPTAGIVAAKAHESSSEGDGFENSSVASSSSSSSTTAFKSVVLLPPPVTVCYIDRQETSRRLPNAFHEWLVDYLESHAQMYDFVHLHMQNYAALDQIRLAASCRVLLGVHGNGLSHVAWMKPSSSSLSSRSDTTTTTGGTRSSSSGGGAVVEFFFDYPFYYDYATLSQLFQLRYFALWNGNVLDAQRIAQRNATILKETRGLSLHVDNNNNNNNTNQTRRKYDSSFAQELHANPAAIAQRLQVAQTALQDFLESTIQSLRN